MKELPPIEVLPDEIFRKITKADLSDEAREYYEDYVRADTQLGIAKRKNQNQKAQIAALLKENRKLRAEINSAHTPSRA
jgi:hypothetical protein